MTPLTLLTLLTCIALLPSPALAQGGPIEGPFEWRSIGPGNMMGRITSIDALETDHRVVVVGSASGGVWLSHNSGTTVEPIFDDYGSQSIGAVALFQGDPDIIWVGTGEAANRNSVGWGDGVYKSEDGGETFEHVGLEDTYQIAEIVTHPTDPDVAYVAALGQLWGTMGSRGVFRTTDGGDSWTELTNGLPDTPAVGASDVNLDPTDPEVVYVGMYNRLRRPWTMTSGGPGGGIFKSVDGGDSFTRLTNGLPTGETGMIDIDIYRQDPSILMAYVEADENLPFDLDVPGSGIYRSEDGGESWNYVLRHTHRPYYHGKIRINPSDDQLVQVVSRGNQYTEDGGETWQGGRWFSSGGGDDHDAWICPIHPDVVYSATDQGAHVQLGDDAHLSMVNMAIGQYYNIGVDMRDPYWVYGGLQDNGGWAVPSRTRNSQGVRNDHAIKLNGGDGFRMIPDPTDWRTVYTAVHVGFFGKIDMLTREKEFITPLPRTTLNFEDHHDPDFDEVQTDYTINPQESWLWGDIPNRTVNGSSFPPQFRWNWNSPIEMSPSNPDVLYVGANHVFKSTDKGETWRIISPDLTSNDPETRNSTHSGGLVRDVTGAESSNTIFAIDESPLDPQVVWAGSDDGHVHVTRDGGDSWTEVTANIPGFPERGWVSWIVASAHEVGTAYVTVDNHRLGDNDPYVWRTTDFGSTWTDLAGALPNPPHRGLTIHALAEDPVDAELLFLGTEFGVYMSMDGGGEWEPFMNGFPPVAARDLVIHPRDHDLIAGTHGRSIWIVDDISPLRRLTPEVRARPVHVFENRTATKWLDRTNFSHRGDLHFNGDNPEEGAAIDFWLASAPEGDVTIEVSDPLTGKTRVLEEEAEQGMNRVHWEFEWDPDPVEVTAYRDELREIHAEVLEAVRMTQDTAGLRTHRLDFMADGRSPGLVDDFEYTDLTDPRAVLVDHLRAVARELEGSPSVGDLNDVREELMAFSRFVGDRAFLGFYGEEMTEDVAEAGSYRVTVTSGGASAEGVIDVREDPIVTRAGTGWMTGAELH